MISFIIYILPIIWGKTKSLLFNTGKDVHPPPNLLHTCKLLCLIATHVKGHRPAVREQDSRSWRLQWTVCACFPRCRFQHCNPRTETDPASGSPSQPPAPEQRNVNETERKETQTTKKEGEICQRRETKTRFSENVSVRCFIHRECTAYVENVVCRTYRETVFNLCAVTPPVAP